MRAGAAGAFWATICELYAELEALTGNPVVRLNRAVAVAEARGTEGVASALALLDGLDARLPANHRLAAVRAELLVRAGRPAEARHHFDLAIARCGNEAERLHLQRRRAGTGVEAGRSLRQR